MYSRQERLSVYHRFTEVPCLRASLNQSKAPWRVCYDEQGLVPLLLPDFILYIVKMRSLSSLCSGHRFI